MVLNSMVVVTVASASASAWQWAACFPASERLRSDQLLDLVLCFPLQQLGRLALCLWTFLCFAPNHHDYYSSSDDDDDDADSSSSTAVDYRDFYYHSHSD